MTRVLRVGSRDLQLGISTPFWILVRSSKAYDGRRIVGNVPCQGMVTIKSVRAGETDIIDDWLDAYLLSGAGLRIDIPVHSASFEVSIRGEYTGLTPPPFCAGCDWKLSFAIHGFTK